MCKKFIYFIACALLLSAASGVQAAVLEITPTAPVPGDLDISNFVGALTDADNVGTEDDSSNPPYWNDWCTYVAHDRGGQGQTFLTGDEDALVTGVWVKHVTYSGADPDQTWYRMQPGSELEIRITDPAAAGTDAFVLASEIYVVTGAEENALPADTTNDQTGASLWFHITLDAPVALAANTEYGFDLTSLSGKAGVMFFEIDGINDRAEGGNPYEAGTAYTSGVNPDDHGDDLDGANDNNMVVAPGDHVFVVDLAPKPPAKIHGAIVNRYSFTDGDTVAVDSISGRDGVLTGTAAISGNQLVLDGGGTVELPGDVLDPGLQSVTIEVWFELNAAQNWQRIFDFGETQNDAGGNTMFYTPTSGAGDSRFVISTNGVPSWQTGEDMVTSTAIEPNTPTHIACVYDGAVPEIRLYQDGSLVGSTPTTMSLSGVSRMFAYIGDAVYTPDPHFDGSIDEFRIYETALTDAEVLESFLAGPDAEAPTRPVHSYTFEDGTANDSVGEAHGTLFGDATIVDGQLVLDGDGDWMDMPGDVIAMNTFEELTIEVMFTSVAGANTGFAMVTAFGESGTGEGPNFGYRYICITPARGDDVSRAMIQTSSMDNDPWNDETGVSDVIEHDDGLPHHMVCTVDDTELAFYIDGVLIGTAALAPGNEIAGIGTDVASIGKAVYPQDPLWIGSVEELNIYNRALSPDQVAAKYAAGPQKAGPAPVDPGTEGLVLHLPLDTASRGVTQDSSDNNLDGTLFGDPTFVEGVVVMAMDFDGDGDYVDCGTNETLNSLNEAISASAWINIRSVTTAWMAVMAKGENAWRISVNGETTGMHFGFSGGDRGWQAANSATELPLNEWHHVAATYDLLNGGLIYIDGVVDGNNPDLGGVQMNEMPFLIGENPEATGRFFDGLIDDVRIYDRTLSAEEVLFLARK